MSRIRAAVLGLVFTLAVGPVPAAHATQAAAIRTGGFVVGGDQRLYHVPSSTGGSSAPTMTRVNNQALAPAGAAVAAVRQANGAFALFVIGLNGGVQVVVPSATGSGTTVFQSGASGVATPGARLAAVTAPAGVFVFFIGTNGAVYAGSFGTVVKPGPVPWSVLTPGTAPPGTTIAAAWTAAGLPQAVFVGGDGGLRSVRATTASGGWTTTALSPATVAPPGGGVAALPGQSAIQAFYSSADGRLWRFTTSAGPQPDPWQPQALSAAGAAPAGAQLAAVYLGPGPQPWQYPAAVFFAASNGAVHVTTNPANVWLSPGATTPGGYALPGGPIAATYDPSTDRALVSWCGTYLIWWLGWRKLVPPPPPPPWRGQMFAIRSNIPIQPAFQPAALTWGS